MFDINTCGFIGNFRFIIGHREVVQIEIPVRIG